MIATQEQPIEILCRVHSPRLLNYLVRLTLGDRRQAEDVLQETLLRAWQQLRKHPAQPESLQPWLYTVARRLVIDHIRARGARPAEVLGNDLRQVPEEVDPIDRMLVQRTMREALLRLTPEQRAVLIELYFQGASPKETADRLGIPIGTVKSRAHYALRALRAFIDEAEAESASAAADA
jgi:RNA polymerase sigma-70 factor, ECF subfamily